MFASTAVNPGGVDGVLAGNFTQIGYQALGVVIVATYAFVVSWVIVKIVHVTMGLRASEENEVQGLDYTEHSEAAYS